MPLTKVTNSMINGACVNVLDKGADQTGVTSSVAAIKDAITDAITNGKNVFFPSGTYLWDDSAFYTIQPAVEKGLILFGEGRSSVISVEQNNTIFNVVAGDTSRFICKNMSFDVADPVTNSNVTMFYVTNGTSYGAYFGFENVTMTGVATGIFGIRAGGAYVKQCNFYGNGKTTGNASVRLWGADGTTVTQDHSFSNFCRFEQCNFNNSTYGIQGFGIAGSTVANCVFQELNIGISNVSNSDGVGGITSSTTRCGYGIANIDIDNSWFEDIDLSNWVNNDVNYITGVPVSGTVYAGASQIFLIGAQYFDPAVFLNSKLANGTPVNVYTTTLQNNSLTVSVANFTTETRLISLGGDPLSDLLNTIGALISVSGYGQSGTGTANALFQVGGFLNSSGNTRITEIINEVSAGFTISLAYSSAGNVLLTCTNGNAQPQTYQVSVILNKPVV